MNDIDELEKRLHNAECALLALYSIVKDILPPDAQRQVGSLQAAWFEASLRLGAFATTKLKRPTEN